MDSIPSSPSRTDADSIAISPESWNYLREEQKQRREEIAEFGARIESDRQYGLLATGVYWSWLLTNTEKLSRPFGVIAALIPSLIMVFFYLRWTALNAALFRAAEYTVRLEALFKLPAGFGWESWLREH